MQKIGFRRLASAVAAALPLVFAACSDQSLTVPPEAAVAADQPNPYRLHCEANTRTLQVQCGGGESGIAPSDLSVSQGQGMSASWMADGTVHVFGGQGLYVNLVSSGVTYNSGTGLFSFNATIQNASSLSMATADGATRHGEGIRVFINTGPTVTSGSGTITVLNATGTGTFLATNQSYYQYGGSIGGTDQTELGADGILVSGETSAAKTWQFNIPESATTFAFDVFAYTLTPPGAVASIAPQVESISPAALIPGTAAVITGVNFDATPANNVVMIGGRAATVTGATTTTLNVTVPCVASGTAAVQITKASLRGAAFGHPLAVTQRSPAMGELITLTSSADSYCNELTSANGSARYLVTVYSNNTSPSSNSPFVLSGALAPIGASSRMAADPAAARVAPLSDDLVTPVPVDGALSAAEASHMRLLEKNAEMYQLLRGRQSELAHRQSASTLRAREAQMDPALTRTFRVSNINAGNICNSYYVVSATRVYYNGKIAIYEDDATPDAFKSSMSATMASNYQKIGDQFNADMEPIVRTNFGNILRRDAETDNNGALIALFTPRINASFSGVAGYVVSCDQFPNDDAATPAVGGPYTGSASNGASNFGEFFYAYQPVTAGSGYSGNTADNWYRTIRSTFIHESKHVASQAARVANNASSYEASWLEEGTARHAEELWMRNAVDNVAWKGNTGYGSAANPINLYCDVRPSGFAECDANSRRPASIMQRHFTSLYTHMFGQNARLLSPFGATASDNASYFYAISWSLVRYTVDRFGASDAAFLTALTNGTSSGVTNLAAVAGASLDQLLSGWTTSLYVDDYPGLASPSANVIMPTWNFRNIYGGLNADFPSTYTLSYPVVPQSLSFGTLAPAAITTLRGGGNLWYTISGTQTAKQLIRLESNPSGLPSANLRIAITRLPP